jgi:hypothetical protein
MKEKENNMKKNTVLFLLALLSIGLCTEGFAQTITNNNTITIQGNVYYFKPATTPSSPQPRVGASDFIGTGSWYGADAAKAWASIADWVVEHCLEAGRPVKPSNGEMVYISSVHAFRANTPDARKYSSGVNEAANRVVGDSDGIVIYYWVVARGEQMEDGRRATRGFRF